MANPITSDTKVIQKKEIPTVELNGEVALMNPEKGYYYGLDPIGSRVWAIMDKQIAIKDIVGILVKEYEVSEEVCEDHVIALIEQLYEQELVSVS